MPTTTPIWTEDEGARLLVANVAGISEDDLADVDDNFAVLNTLAELVGKDDVAEWASTSHVAHVAGFVSSGAMGDDGRARALRALRRLERVGVVAIRGRANYEAQIIVEPTNEHALDAIARGREPRVVPGPAGHWYCVYGGELLAAPRLVDGPKPDYPTDDAATFCDGWYAPDDLQGQARERVLRDLGSPEGVV